MLNRSVFILSLALVAIVATLAIVIPSDASYKFYSKHGRYSVVFPSTPKEEISVANDNGKEVNLYFASVKNKDIYYAVTYSDDYRNKKLTTNKQINEFLDAARDGAVANVSGKLTSEEIIKVDGYTGRIFKVSVPGNGVVLSMVVLVGSRMYNAIVASSADKFFSSGARNFIDSFKLEK